MPPSAAQIKAIKRKLAEVVYYFKQEIKPCKTFNRKRGNSYAAGSVCLI